MTATTEPTPPVTMPHCKSLHRLTGQVALVTGASSGIGRAVAFSLAREGAVVGVNYVGGHDAAMALVDEITQFGGQALAIRADVSDEQQVEDMFSQMIETFGTVDILINNAGLQQDAAFDQMSLAQWQRVIDVNQTGQFLCARAAIREFKKRGVRPDISCAAGKIIGISSVHEVIPWAGHVNYAASKGGVMMMTKSIAQEVAPFRIRVNSICPGAIRTPINRDAWETEAAYDQLMTLIPYRRIGEPEDIGRAAVWMASDESDYINGISLFVDGGMTLYPGFAEGG